MLFFPRRIEQALDVTIQRSHHAYPGKHRRTVMLRNEEERRHRGLPQCSLKRTDLQDQFSSETRIGQQENLIFAVRCRH